MKVADLGESLRGSRLRRPPLETEPVLENSAKEPVSQPDADPRPEPVVLDPSTWVDAHGDYLFRYANLRLRDAGAAEEVVQDTFLAGIRFLDRYHGKGEERAWLLGILKRKLVDYVRKRARFDRDRFKTADENQKSDDFDARGQWKTDLPAFSLPEKSVESRELWDVVKGCLNTLPDGQADVFVLSVMEEMDSEQICRELDISPSNFWVRLHRARLALAKCVSARWFDSVTGMTGGGSRRTGAEKGTMKNGI